MYPRIKDNREYNVLQRGLVTDLCPEGRGHCSPRGEKRCGMDRTDTNI